MSCLYIVATPIGNLDDVSKRALQILTSVDFIIAEDTRRSKRLLDRYDISTPLTSGHQHSRDQKVESIIERIKSGEQAALVTDAGTPGISDPGGKFAEAALKEDITIIPIPGPSSLAAILSVCPWLTDPVLFVGYLPKKKGRQTFLGKLKESEDLISTLVIFESPERIEKTLRELYELLGNKQIVVGRELTKQFEEITYGTLGDVTNKILTKKGEYVVAVNTR